MRPYPLPHRLLSLTLALLVLVASVGLPVQRRTCRLSGHSTARVAWRVAPTGIRPGAGPLASPASKREPSKLAGSCYAYHLQLHQLSAPAYAAVTLKLPAAPDWLALPPAAAAVSYSLPPSSRLKRAKLVVGIGPAPPLRPGGRGLLVRIGLLLV